MLTGSAALFAFVAPAPAMLAPHATSLMRRPHFPVAMSAETDVLLDGVTTEDDTPRPPPPEPSLTPVLLLGLLFTTNQWARQLPFYTVDFKAPATEEAARMFMNIDIGFDAGQYGVLASIGFAAFFALASLFAGGLTDRVDSRNLLTGTAALWSGATVWQASATSFNEVLASRIVTGIGQAFSNPASYTILSRIYPEDRRASVNGLYASGLYFGGGLAALSVLLDQSIGWRGSFLLVGAISLTAAGVAQTALPPLPPPPAVVAKKMIEPVAEESPAVEVVPADEAEEPSVISLVSDLIKEPTVSLLLLASTLRFLAGFTIGVWIVPFYREAFSGSIGAEFALIKAAVNGVAGSVSATGGGLLADRLSKRDARFNQWVPAIGSLLAIPFWLGTLNAPTLELSLGALFLEYLFAECWFGPTIAGLQAAAPANAQGLITGVFSCLTFVGNLAPFLIGLAVSSGDYELNQLLAISVPVLYGAAAVAFVAAGQTKAAAAQDSR